MKVPHPCRTSAHCASYGLLTRPGTEGAALMGGVCWWMGQGLVGLGRGDAGHADEAVDMGVFLAFRLAGMSLRLSNDVADLVKVGRHGPLDE